MKKIAIAEATDAQLRTFATDVQLIEKVPTDRGGILAALTEAGWIADYIIIHGEAPPTDSNALVDEPAPPLVLDQFDSPEEVIAEMPASGFAFWTKREKGKPPCPMVVCKILSTDRPGGNDPAHPVINNSPPLVIKRGVPVRIPVDFYRVLKQAGGTALIPPEGGVGDPIRQDYREYPMEVIELPTAAAVAAWDTWAGSHELGRPKAAAAA